jgi:iron complex outermembrane receptor protein
MTRSKLRKVRREHSKAAIALKRGLPLAGAMLAGLGVAQAQQAEQTGQQGGLEEVVVSALKRQQSLQDVPLSIQAIGEERLAELNVSDFGDYVKFLPSVSYQTFGPGLARPYMRGVASGENANHSGPLPSVGVYLDEQPITTIQGALDVQIYDIARVEVLAGPQGTLYGASSQSGTIRIITNKPDPSDFAAGYEVSVNTRKGDIGYTGQGFANIPLGDSAAIRLVGWKKKEAGYIDNVVGSRTFPTSGIEVTNTLEAEDNYNDIDKIGARAALKVDLGENWSITPSMMAQKTEAGGAFGYDPSLGDLKVSHSLPEGGEDKWTQAALTVQGKIGNWDLTYAGSYLKRDVDLESDYSDYSFYYDSCCEYGNYWYDDDGVLINPSQFIVGADGYTKQSHELRVSSPAENRWRLVAGVFTQKQTHDILQQYKIGGISDALEVPNNPDVLWLTDQERIDEDSAVFGEFSFDITSTLTATAGIRRFEADNSLRGFFGYGVGYAPEPNGTGEAQCFDGSGPFRSAPCVNLDKNISESGNTKKLNIAWHATDDVMLYATFSEGFRPGGINRKGTLPPFKADFLTNYEVGFKTSWAGNRVRFNGAIFQDDWDDFQYSFLGQNGLTEIKNAGQAQIRGIETELTWAVTDNFTLSNALSYLDAKTTVDYCGTTYGAPNLDGSDPFVEPDDPLYGEPVTNCSDPLAPIGTFVQAPSGQQLPVQPKFKTNAVARYTFQVGGFEGHAQAAVVYQGSAWSDLRTMERELVGKQESYTIADFSFGISHEKFSIDLFVNNAFDERAEIARFAQCSTYKPGEAVPVPLCGQKPYTVTNLPRTIGISFAQSF